MKLDFLHIGGGGGGSGHGAHRFDLFTPKAAPEPPRLDDARHIIRVGLIAGGLFFGVLGLVSITAPISGAAVAPGEVTTSGSTIVVQPANGGVISETYVTEGQRVRAGQPLVRLNGVRSGAAAEQAQTKRDGLRALQARLIAERDGLSAIAFPADLTSRGDEPHVRQLMAAQSAIFARHDKILGADRSIAATQTVAAEAQRVSARKQLTLINDELAGIRTLYNKGYARLTQVRALERAAAELEAQLATTTSAVSRTTLEQMKLADTQVMSIVDQLNRVDEQLAQIDPALRVSRYNAERDLLRAQVAGRVSGVVQAGSGTVVGAGKTLMHIVPDGRTLIVQAMIKPADIDDVKLGSTATLRFPTINPHGQSSFEGKVVALSPARVAEGGFRAQIAVTDTAALRQAKVELHPGEPVTVHIKTRSRTLFHYLFSPLEDAASGAFREE